MKLSIPHQELVSVSFVYTAEIESDEAGLDLAELTRLQLQNPVRLKMGWNRRPLH